MPIQTRLLNKQASVHRIIPVESDTGDAGHESVEVIPEIRIRITSNDTIVSNMGRLSEQGVFATVSHLGFILPSVAVLKGDLITCDGVRYRVQYVEANPGGVSDHHKELYLEAVH